MDILITGEKSLQKLKGDRKWDWGRGVDVHAGRG